MKNKKIIMYVAVIILILFIVGIGFLLINTNNNEIINEYTPVEEITDEQLRQTNILLYFYDNISGELTTEIKQIDAKILLENPENKLIEYLIAGPENSDLINLFPENTKLISTEINNDNLLINFSKEFRQVEELEEEIKNNLINAILKTVSQLNEINEIKILIEGEEI